MEGETEGLMCFVPTLSSVEQVLLQIVTNGEQAAAGSVGRGVYTVRACNTLRDCSCKTSQYDRYVLERWLTLSG